MEELVCFFEYFAKDVVLKFAFGEKPRYADAVKATKGFGRLVRGSLSRSIGFGGGR
ncbi:hypothetical protein MPNT_120008 [Candidatus Methylacidithermus pantelleriae]|uniref:Uncharacterized protein n=1 Tax=Candidatus Methylacidithermus pantelleriae TaxID=2744239 RepID=A0A8J2FN19_9BACT|nr:hypothetical protein MPNT_120008 [Candidatus Methylacidithermus pantelleriae]